LKRKFVKKSPSDNPTNELTKARNYAFLLLKYRLRSIREIRGRLERKGFSPDVIQSTVAFLIEKEFVNDVVFSRAWIESRLRANLGPRKIELELINKGIERNIIDEQLKLIRTDYQEDKQIEEIVRKRFQRLNILEPKTAKRKIYAYLLRRGFSPDIVSEKIKQL